MISVRFVSLLLMSSLLSACAVVPDGGRRLPSVDAAWVSESMPSDEIDSVSVWHAGNGGDVVVATAKSGDRLIFLDASDGRMLDRFGESGQATGQFKAPNGIAIDGDLAFVVERDNHRVQVVDLSTKHVLGTFGDSVLRRPFGLWLLAHGGGAFHVFVTDSYDVDAGQSHSQGLDGRVKTFAVRLTGSGVQAELERRFGSTGGEGALHYVESIWGDPPANRLLVADEHPDHRDIKVFDLAGRFTGQILGAGVFAGEPEGIALIKCESGAGYWLVSDQHDSKQAFRLFDRQTLAPVGVFASGDARGVDGIWFQPGRFGRFPAGVLFSQHDNAAVVAFDWRAIASALSLRSDCGTRT